MKKKLISFCTILCLLFPCFFAVACKEKVEGEKVKAYTYSITLKNAKGKIDESSLADEYDYASETNVTWKENNGDYNLSVTRTTALSGNVIVSLLEGYDYSNLKLTVNEEEKEFSISSGDNLNCADDAYLADRQFLYAYSKMSKDSSVVLDFSNCNLAKISLDVTNLKTNGVKYYIVEDNFVSLEQAQGQEVSKFATFTDNQLVVDYGSIIAFDYSEQLVLNNDEFDKPQTFNYSTTGSMYFTANNRVQYLEAQKSGKCEVYSITSDTSKNGTVRILSSSGLKYTDSLQSLTEGHFELATHEFEYFDGEMLSLSIYKANTAFIELDEEAQNFNYFLVNKLDETLDPTSNIVEKKVDENTEKVYLELNLSDDAAAKYLIRKPIKNSQYFIVYATGLSENTRIVNADAIVVGDSNKPASIPSAVKDSILYYFKNEKEVQVSIPSLLSDKKSDGGQIINNVTISAKNLNISNGSTVRSINPVTVNPANYTSMTVDCYIEPDTNLYRFEFSYSIKAFEEATFTVSAENLHLYEGESVYYSKTPSVGSSWEKLTTQTSLELTSGDGSALYYYIVSNREDADLKIVDAINENISESNRYHDCFGRTLLGSVAVDGEEIDLTKIKSLEIVSGYYNYNQKLAKIVRNYDEKYHNVNMENVTPSNIMVSLDGGLDIDDFVSLEELGSLKIRYNELIKNGEIYYYVNSEVNEYLVLKDSEGSVVSNTQLVYTNGYVESIYNCYVYSLSLNASYYEENAEFTLALAEVSYNLYNENQEQLQVYTSNSMSDRTTELYVNTSYFVEREEGFRLDVYDEFGVKLVDWASFIHISDIDSMRSLYLFTFEFPQYANYEPGTRFILVKSEI